MDKFAFLVIFAAFVGLSCKFLSIPLNTLVFLYFVCLFRVIYNVYSIFFFLSLSSYHKKNFNIYNFNPSRKKLFNSNKIS